VTHAARTGKRSRQAAWAALAGVALVLATACAQPSKGTAMTHSDAEGLWQQASEGPAPAGEGSSMASTYTFRYQAGQVTLRLITLGKVSWRSPDDIYVLTARWQGDTLQYLTPVGQWIDLAVFEAGHFVASGDGTRRVFARITPAQIAEFSAGLLAPRQAHDYAKSMK
jgi:hypothetical protein